MSAYSERPFSSRESDLVRFITPFFWRILAHADAKSPKSDLATRKTPNQQPTRGELGHGMDTSGDGGVVAVGGDGEVAEAQPPIPPPEVLPNLETSRAALALFDAQMQRAATKVQAVHRGRLSRRSSTNILQLSTARVAEIVKEAAKQFMEDIRNPRAGNPFELTDCSEVNVQQQLSRLRNAHRKKNTSKSASSARFRWGAATVCSACGSNPRAGVHLRTAPRGLLPTRRAPVWRSFAST